MLRLAIVAFLLTPSISALADPPGENAPAPTTPPVESYRLETAAVDATALGLLLIANARGGESSDKIAEYGVIIGLLGAPIIHVLHLRPSHALGSAALRVAVPFIVGYASQTSCLGPQYDCSERDVYWGAAIGLGVAMVLDTWLLAKGDEPPVMPAVSSQHGAMTFGLAGRF